MWCNFHPVYSFNNLFVHLFPQCFPWFPLGITYFNLRTAHSFMLFCIIIPRSFVHPLIDSFAGDVVFVFHVRSFIPPYIFQSHIDLHMLLLSCRSSSCCTRRLAITSWRPWWKSWSAGSRSGSSGGRLSPASAWWCGWLLTWARGSLSVETSLL